MEGEADERVEGKSVVLLRAASRSHWAAGRRLRRRRQRQRRWRRVPPAVTRRRPRARTKYRPLARWTAPRARSRYCQGKDTAGDAKALGQGVQRRSSNRGRHRRSSSSSRPTPASSATSVRAAPGGQVRRLRHLLLRRDLDRGVRLAEVALRHDASTSRRRRTEFIPATLDDRHLRRQVLGLVPNTSDAAFLYYRTDKVKDGPGDLAGRLHGGRARQDGIVYQGAAYEGLTCDFLEIAFAAGGKVLSEDGKKADVRLAGEPQGAPVHGRRHQERRRSEGRDDVHGGGVAARLRGRPRRPSCATGRTRTRPARRTRTPPKFEVAPFPAFEGGGKAGILGGHNDVISVYSKNPGGALKLVDYLLARRSRSQLAADFSLPPAIVGGVRRPERQEGAPVRGGAEAGDRAGQGPPGLAGLPADLRRRSTRTSTRRCREHVSPEDALKKAQTTRSTRR